MGNGASSEPLLQGLSNVLASPLGLMIPALSELISPLVPHSALVMLAADVGGGRVQGTGDPAFVRGVRGLELDRLRKRLEASDGIRSGVLAIDGAAHPTLELLSRNGALLVIAEPGSGAGAQAGTLLALWDIVALHVQERADEAKPDYLQHARAIAGTRLKALTELEDEYAAAVESVLVALRSKRLSDAQARDEAVGRAVDALTRLSGAVDQVRTLTEESVTISFDRLKEDLRPVSRYSPVQLQFVDPPVDGRPLPGEVSLGARAVVYRAVLTLVEGEEVGHIRIHWDCDGTNLLIRMQDDGPGSSAAAKTLLGRIRERIWSLNGTVGVDTTPGWGTRIDVVLPLDPPRTHPASSAMAGMRPREVQVAALMVAGHRNRAIADELRISENTVKFHVSRILRQLGADSRAEAIAVLTAGQRG
ncbi:LuxR C-terminal-related transcriptional regulator [Leucobacter sp. UCD-THU]|uniref:LuxR C-terminal-related transcriptional regulator n=1 Tax=Leucobacter sp. UCD-THU TaxID=1292023 RepID=UPI0004CF318C|nr:LuxR C-terminal-related transcriptional regulator [Leucobacter sp. UCD-THU]